MTFTDVIHYSSDLVFFIGLFICLIFLVVISGEVIFRLARYIDHLLFSEYVSRRDFIDEKYHPYVDWVEDWNKPNFFYLPIGLRLFNIENPIIGRVKNNSLGFRAAEFSPPSDDVLRILLIGGSTAWGSGASSNEQTISANLEKIINDDRRLLGKKKCAECINLAQMRGTQTQDLLSIMLYADRLKPDIVVSLTGWNELITSHFMDDNYLEKYRAFYVYEMADWVPLNVPSQTSKLLRESGIKWLSSHSFFL